MRYVIYDYRKQKYVRYQRGKWIFHEDIFCATRFDTKEEAQKMIQEHYNNTDELTVIPE